MREQNFYIAVGLASGGLIFPSADGAVRSIPSTWLPATPLRSVGLTGSTCCHLGMTMLSFVPSDLHRHLRSVRRCYFPTENLFLMNWTMIHAVFN
jgi:hypothetical protein